MKIQKKNKKEEIIKDKSDLDKIRNELELIRNDNTIVEINNDPLIEFNKINEYDKKLIDMNAKMKEQIHNDKIMKMIENTENKVDLNDPLIPKEEQKLSEEELERLERLQTRTRALEKHSVLYYLILNALSMIAMGVINFHFKLMKKIIGLQNYDEYSFSIWRSFWTMTIDIIAIYCMKETT